MYEKTKYAGAGTRILLSVRVFNRNVSKNFQYLITDIAENIIDDFCTIPYLSINLIKGPEKSDEVSETTVFLLEITLSIFSEEKNLQSRYHQQ